MGGDFGELFQRLEEELDELSLMILEHERLCHRFRIKTTDCAVSLAIDEHKQAILEVAWDNLSSVLCSRHVKAHPQSQNGESLDLADEINRQINLASKSALITVRSEYFRFYLRRLEIELFAGFQYLTTYQKYRKGFRSFERNPAFHGRKSLREFFDEWNDLSERYKIHRKRLEDAIASDVLVDPSAHEKFCGYIGKDVETSQQLSRELAETAQHVEKYMGERWRVKAAKWGLIVALGVTDISHIDDAYANIQTAFSWISEESIRFYTESLSEPLGPS